MTPSTMRLCSLLRPCVRVEWDISSAGAMYPEIMSSSLLERAGERRRAAAASRVDTRCFRTVQTLTWRTGFDSSASLLVFAPT